MCKVTVITVTYNAEKCIEETMNSVFSQKYNDFEYIIKDGNSSDSTNCIVKSIIECNRNKGISVNHIISKDMGIYDAMNEAVKQANGEWIIFMNAGDTFYNANVLSDVFSIQYDNCIGVLYGHAMLKLNHNRRFIVSYESEFMKQGVSICHQSVFEKKEYLENYPFNTKFKILADRDHLLYLYLKGVPYYKINTVVAIEDRHGISSIDYAQVYRENQLVNEKYKLVCQSCSIQIERIKMAIKKCVPLIEEWVMIRKAMKRMGRI